MSQNMRYYLKVPANFIPIQILPAKVGRPMLNFGRPIVRALLTVRLEVSVILLRFIPWLSRTFVNPFSGSEPK